ncbi:hypothetical protein GGH95_004420, partial [Coemansia sp. RSA 1836]
MYMKVDEDEYQRRIRQAGGAMNDFVVDDDGAGYVDEGLDDIGGSTTGKQTKIKPAGRRPNKTPVKTPMAKESARIGTLFKNAQLKSTSSVKKKAATTQDDEEF